ncbi:uncharacterized protein I303_107576 [Kwoniella dejecticola CBS 10117]|uniref:2-hydroxyacid dehydrogenase n=1 Tax=Kwoniella dejecticola CBS 10117 TaxID=1296121 RepID=A0A1A5ZV42_9TREE|nr:uncharacterized protein I303_07586 [Kwoniella dejecticola CBS 10117]OBR81676.1 hypothetical protein I303_07586 [Kwoniella dejecticola CBS 10117]
MAPKVLLMGELYWAGKDAEQLLGGIADVVSMESSSREELFKDFASGGRYSDVVAIYHEHLSDKITGHPDTDFMNALPSSCKWFAHKGAGYDSVDVHTAKSRGIGVSNTPGAVDEATATTAVFLLIATMRRFSQCEAVLRAGGFVAKGVEESARDLSGKTVGILGMGGIGLQMANYIRPFGCNLVYHNRKPNALAPPDVKYIADLYDMLGQVDVLMVSIPLSEKTRGFIGEKEIRAMKKGSIIVNTARGPVIDEEAMIKALQDGHLGSVGLDVFVKEPEVDQRLRDMPHVTLLPHVGTENQDARRKMEVTALTNIKEYLTNGVGPNLVPECK